MENFEFEWSQTPETLRQVYKSTNFDTIFHKLISKDVIAVLSPQSVSEPHNLIYDDDVVHKHLIAPLERFICNGGDLTSSSEGRLCNDEEVDMKLENIKKLKQQIKLCRKTLKTGDVFFSCIDCGFDGTCVICIDCFHKSAHKGHKYRMFNTEGGGCCDCGDVEAWKQFPACSEHQTSGQLDMKLSDFEEKELRAKQIEKDKLGILEKIALLPKGYASRYFLVCQASLHYARTMLTWTDYHSLPEYLCIEDQIQDDVPIKKLISRDHSTKNYFTVLFNDEVHTYDHVINTLVKVIKCTKMTASVMASSVSREGRSLILQDQLKPCKQVRDSIATVRDPGQGSLRVEVMHGTILAHQAYALKLIEWIQRMSLLCDAFRILTAYTLLGSYDSIPEQEEPSADMTLLEKVMRSNTTYWKLARIDWNDLFVTTLLTEYSIKEKFARLLTRNYPDLVEDFINDDHDHSVSILTMTTQLYTVPSLICMLIEEENALSIIVKKLIDVCNSTKRENSTISFENRSTFDMLSLKRGFYIIPDIKHLINIEPTKWTNQLRHNVIEAVKIFLTLLNSMQGIDSVKRQLGQHLEYEQEWETGMTLQSRLIPLISRLVTYCSLDEHVLTETLRETQLRLLEIGHYKTVTKELFGHSATCIQYDVSASPVSVHLPLTRFAAALIIELMKRRQCNTTPYDESLVILTSDQEQRLKSSVIDIMEPSLRTEVMVAQFRSGMWRRNGFSLANQIIYFSGALMRKEMYDRDILVLQEGAAMCDANKFIIHLLNKFNLFTWVTSDTTREPLVGPKAVSFYNDEEILTQTMTLGEEFLQLLLTIISERYRVGLGKIEDKDVIKNEIIQLLCIGPFTRSDITQKLYVDDHEIDCIESVANLRRSSESSTGKYELKEEYYDRFNPFFYHYNRRYQSHALDSQFKRKRNAKEALICCPPPKPVELVDQFKNLNELLRCDLTLIIIQKILRRANGPSSKPSECSTKAPIRFDASDLQLDQCLHLIGLGLHEQERYPLVFDYLKAAHEKDIFALLRDCHKSTERSKDLIFWLMRKADSLIDRIDKEFSSDDDGKRAKMFSTIKEYFSPILSASDTIKRETKQKNSQMAAQLQKRIMAQMKANRDKFMANLLASESASDEAKSTLQEPANAPLSQEAVGESSASTDQASMDYELTDESSVPGASCRVDSDTISMHAEDNEDAEEDDHGLQKRKHLAEKDRQFVGANHLCILCRDEQTVAFDKPTMVLLAYVQRSAVLSKNRKERRIPNYSLTPSNQLKHLPFAQPDLKAVGSAPERYSFTSDNSWSFDASFMPADLFFGPHISTCGHVMHYDCWKSFSDAVTKRETTRLNRGGRHISYELEKDEILCPLCECISNATIPLLPDYTSFTLRDQNQHAASSTVFGSNAKTIERSSEKLNAFLHAIKGTVTTYKHVQHLNTSQQQAAKKEDKHMRLLQPATINDVLKELDESEALVLRDFIATISSEQISSSICTKNLLSSIQTLADRIHSIGLDLDKSITDVHHARIFMMTTWSISYSIQAQERTSRFKGWPLFEGIESSKNLCLSSLVRFACASMMTHQSDIILSFLVQKLRYLFVSEEHLMSSPCCLDIDAFELLVSIFIMLHKLYSHMDKTSQVMQSSINMCYDHEYYRNLLHLLVIFNMLQVLITIQNDEIVNDDAMAQDEPSGECAVLHKFYQDVILASEHPNNKLHPMNQQLVVRVKQALLPFLRSCAIFFYHLSHIKPEPVLLEQSAFYEGKNFATNGEQSGVDEKFSAIDETSLFQEYDSICHYLNLPSDLSKLIKSQEARKLALTWLSHARVHLLIKTAMKDGSSSSPPANPGSSELMPIRFIRQPHLVNRLIDLPYDYSELVNKVKYFTCPSIRNEDSRTPTMCLVCGIMLCSQSYCCQRDLNDLASNYKQVMKRQEETRQQWLAAHDSVSDGPSGSSAASHYYPAGSAAAAAAGIHSRALAAISLLFPSGGTGGGSGAAAAQSFTSIFGSHIGQQLVGSCTYHAHECSGGVGVFLRIRNCQILLLSGRSKGCYMPAPYIDDHGETDFGLMRGAPLHLAREHYESLQHSWLTHSIPERISRALQNSSYASNINWHLH